MGLSHAVPSGHPSRLLPRCEQQCVATGRKAPSEGSWQWGKGRQQRGHQRLRRGGLVQKLVKALAAQALREVDWLAEERPRAALGEDAMPAGESGRRGSVSRTVLPSSPKMSY